MFNIQYTSEVLVYSDGYPVQRSQKGINKSTAEQKKLLLYERLRWTQGVFR